MEQSDLSKILFDLSSDRARSHKAFSASLVGSTIQVTSTRSWFATQTWALVTTPVIPYWADPQFVTILWQIKWATNLGYTVTITKVSDTELLKSHGFTMYYYYVTGYKDGECQFCFSLADQILYSVGNYLVESNVPGILSTFACSRSLRPDFPKTK